MEEKEKDRELTLEEETDQEFSLEEIMKEFSGGEETAQQKPVTAEESAEPEEEIAPEALSELEQESSGTSADTVRIELPAREQAQVDMSDTIRLGDTIRMEGLAEHEEEFREEPPRPPQPEKAEPFSEDWEPEYEQPIGEYVPPQPIIFRPRSRLRELKRKLVAGPELRYYEINEQGFGKLQMAIFLSLLVVALSAGATALYAMGMVQANRMKLMVFGQFLAMLLSAVLGSYQLMEGISDLFHKRFTLNTMLVFTFIACCVDGVFCLQQLRVPCCAAFSLQVTMSLWSSYQRRVTEMGQMDTMRKAVRLDSIVEVKDYHDGCSGLLRGEGQVEDFMDNYNAPSGPEKVLSAYALVALLVSVGIGVAAGVLHSSVSFGVQVLSVSLLAAVPVTSFITLTRPMAVLEKRLHKAGSVICGWQGVKTMSRRVLFPLGHEDLFPAGSSKLNGVKFYGSRDPDQVVAYCAALISADGGGLAPLFDHLLNSRNGRHYTVENLNCYGGGGIGGEVHGEPVLIGGLPFLKEMGVEIPEGISVNQAVYAAIDGELCGVFAVTYSKVKSSAAGLSALCSYRGLRPVLTTGDFMLTEGFIRSRFSVNTRRICFPERAVRAELKEKVPEADAPAVALVTTEGLMPFAYAVAGARSVRTASILGTVIHMLGGILGLAMMLILAVLGVGELLTPANLFLYELVWIIPGLLITEWTRTV